MVVLLCCAAFSGCATEKEPMQMIDVPIPSPSSALLTPAAPVPTRMPTPSPTPISTPSSTPEPAPEVRKSYPLEDRSFYYQALDNALKARITGMSFPSKGEDCAISYDDLCYIGILYCDFIGETHTGELIVNQKVAEEVTEIFYELYQNKYPLASVRLVDDYKEPGDDNKSMAANNTSAFNYRRVTGSKTLSRHSYGAAVDINPLFNPYIDHGRVAPPEAEPYANRDWDFPGKIDHDDLCYQLFIRNGWVWGGDWSGDKDYQHFSKDIGY